MKPSDHPPDWPPRRHGEPPRYSGRDARGGEIILRTKARRWIFLGGLAAFVLLVIAVSLAGII